MHDTNKKMATVSSCSKMSITSTLNGFLLKIGSLSKDNVDDSENVI